MVSLPSNIGYEQEAPELLVRYEQLPFGAQMTSIQPFLLPHFASVLDIGAGTGQAAAWFASQGAQVVAVEPTDVLRAGAQRLHPIGAITWLDEGLPDLKQVLALGRRFDLIWIDAVWMHLDLDERQTAMAAIVPLMASSAALMISLRHGPVPQGRRMFEVSGEETVALAAGHGLCVVYNGKEALIGKANIVAGVTWTRLVFKQGPNAAGHLEPGAVQG
jgi:SAM-dependent methyltransferase